MSFKNKFDFCLISNPYHGKGKSIIFITARGLEYIDETIIVEDEYRKLKSFLENLNFIEIEFCSFEYNGENIIAEDDLINKIETRDVRYSKSLEIKISNSFSELYKQKNTNQFSGYNLPIESPKYKVPNIGEKISLYFYLFLECHFINEDDCVIFLNGEFNTKENNHYRNFLKIAKSDFVRIESDVPNILTLQSAKKYKNFINEINILHRGNFQITKPFVTDVGQSGYKTKEYQYNFVEINKNINPDNNIVVQINLDRYFNKTIERSKEIKKELTSTEKKPISIDLIKSEISFIKNKLESKMINSAESDEYEIASFFKKNIILLNDKLNIISDIDKENMSIGEYMKIFTLN